MSHALSLAFPAVILIQFAHLLFSFHPLQKSQDLFKKASEAEQL